MSICAKFEEATIEYAGSVHQDENIWEVDYQPVGSPVSFGSHVALIPITPNVTHIYTDDRRDYMGSVYASNEDEFLIGLATVIETYYSQGHSHEYRD